MFNKRDHECASKGGAGPTLHAATTQAPDDDSSHPEAGDTTQLAASWSAASQEDEIRRKEFTNWLLHRTRRVASVGGSRGRASLDERRAQRIEAKLQEKLALAEAKRAAGLAKLQQRAATSSLRREGAAERAAAAAAERSAAAAARLDADLAAAESRRLALREAEKERLRADHELVLSRLTTSQERAATESAAQLSRLEERLRLAACTREARLARRAAKAAGKVEHARNRGAACREARQQEVESKRVALERKLEEARERRESARTLAAAASPLTPRSRTSLNGMSSLAMSPRTPGAGDGGLFQGISAALGRDATVGSGSPGGDGSPAARDKTGEASPTLEALVLSTGEATGELVPGTGQTSGAAQPSRQGLAPAPLRLVPGPQLGHVVHLHRRHTTHSAHPPHGHHQPSTLGQLTDKQQGAAAMASSPSVAVTAAMAGAGAALAPSDHAMGRGAAAAGTADVADAAARLEWLRLNRSTRRLQEGWRAFAVAKKTTRALAEAFVAQKVTSVKLPSPPAHVSRAAPNAPAGGDAAGSSEVRPGASKPVDVPGAGGSDSGSATVWFGVGSPRKGGAGAAAPWDGGEEAEEEEGDGFERFAAALRSPATLRATQALMRRLELRLAARGVALSSAARLLRRLFPRAQRDAPLERYPPRVLLCAFMVVRYPQVVFSAGGPREMALAAASRELVSRFEALLGRLLAPSPGGAAGNPAKQGLSGLPEEQAVPGEDSPCSGPPDHLAASPVARGMAELRMQRMRRAASAGGAPMPASPAPQFVTLGELLVSFDEAWLSYLDQFVAWKGADAAALEGELVRMAAAMQASMLRKCRGDPDSERCRASSDLQTIIAQTAHDVGLLRERVAKLGGEAGLGRLEAALQAARQAVAAELAEGGASASASATASEVDTDIESPSRPRPYGAAPMLASPTRSARTPPSGAATPSGGTPRQQAAASPHAARPQGAAPNGVAPTTPGRPPATAPIAVPPRPQAAASPRDVPASMGAASGGGSPARTSLTSMSASPRTPGSLSSAALSHAPLDAVSNAAMVLDMLHAQGSYRLSASDAEGAWSRAVAAMERGFSSSAAAAPLLPPPLDMAELAAMGQEQLVRSLRSRTSAIAEAAFWANVASRLGAALRGGAPPLPALLAPLMSEVAAEVAGLMGSTQQAATIRSEFSEAAVAAALEGAEAGGGVGVAVQRSLGAMQRLAGLLLAAGAPAREEEALRAHRAMKQELLAAAAEWAERQRQAAAGGDSEGDSDDEGGRAAAPPGLASALAAALRLLAAQVKLIRVDAANSRLQMLAASLPGDSAVAYLKGKFAAIFGGQQQQQDAAGLSGPTSSPGTAPAAAPQLLALPRMRAWLGRSTAAAAALERYLGAQGIDLRGAVAAVAAAAAAGPKADASVPVALRSGLAARPTSGSGATPSQYPTVTPEAPVGPPGGSGGDPSWGWRWLVRCGVVALVTGDAPAVGPGLAETLLWDGERLHAAQNQFQQLLVVTAGLLLVSQLRAAAAQASAPSAAGWGPEQRAAAGRRLLVVAADPGMRLPDLTAELSAMAGVAGDTAAEERLRGAFMSLVDPSSAAFRSLANALAASLLLHVALGTGAAAPGGGEPLASRAATALLARVGAAALAGDVAALGGRLLSLCAVNEAVHGEAYERAVREGLEEQQGAGQGGQHQAPGSAQPSRVGQAQAQAPQRAAQASGARGGQDEESSEELEEILADGDEI